MFHSESRKKCLKKINNTHTYEYARLSNFRKNNKCAAARKKKNNKTMRIQLDTVDNNLRLLSVWDIIIIIIIML